MRLSGLVVSARCGVARCYRRQRRIARLDAGQGTLEYVGMIAVAAILVVSILQATKSVDLAGFFTSAIRSVTGGGGGGGADSGGG